MAVPTVNQIDHLVVKFNSSAVIDEMYNCYYWGSYYDGELKQTPEKIMNFEARLIDFSLGLKHAIALVEGGEVYTWGDGSYGELGHGH